MQHVDPHDQHPYIKTEVIQLRLIARFVESNPTELAEDMTGLKFHSHSQSQVLLLMC